MEESRRSGDAAGHRSNSSGAKRAKASADPYENKLVAYYREEEEWLLGSAYDGATVLVGLVHRKMISNRFAYILEWVPLPDDSLLAFDPTNSLHVNTNLANYFDLHPKVDLLTLAQGRELFYSLGIKNIDLSGVARCAISPETQDWTTEIPWDAHVDTQFWDHDAMHLHVQLEADHFEGAISLKPMVPVDQLRQNPLFPPLPPNVPTTMKLVSPDHATMFSHSAVASFLAYLPIKFWDDVVSATNIHGLSTGCLAPATTFKLSEVMAYLGILLHINLFNRFDTLADYWRSPPSSGNIAASTREGHLLASCGLSLPRFQLLHQALRCTKFRDATDPLSALRPLVRALQCECIKTIVPGQDLFVTVDSHVVVDGAHVQLYVVTCAATGVVVAFKLHVTKQVHPSAIVRNVVEAVHPFHHSQRVVHVHSPFVSVGLVDALRSHGLYCRASTNVPACVFRVDAAPDLVASSDLRPTMWAQPASPTSRGLLAVTEWRASRLAFGLLTNADAPPERHGAAAPMPAMVKTHLTTHARRHKMHKSCSFDPAHSSILEEPPAIPWAQSVLLHLLDIARVNAYLAQRHAVPDSDASIWEFTSALSAELIHGEWEFCPPHGVPRPPTAVPVDEEVPPQAGAPERPCVPRRSKAVFALKRPGKDSRCKTRQCVVCRWETTSKTKSVTEVTDYCDVHDVCLCSCVRQNYTPAPYMCPNAEWTCWEKYHRFYMPEKLFVKDKGARVQRQNWMYKLRHGKTKRDDGDHESDDNGIDDRHLPTHAIVPRPGLEARPTKATTSARMSVTLLTRPHAEGVRSHPDSSMAPIQYL